VHTFNTYCSGSRALVAPFGYTGADVQFGPSPIAHTTGLVTSVFLPMLTGASTHLMAEWDPARGIDEIQRFGCTAAVTAPTFLHTLLSEYDPAQHDLSSLRLWTCAGAPIPAAVVERAGATLPNIKVLSLYGRSENLVTTSCSVDDDVSRALISDGKALPGAEVRIVDPQGNEVPRGTEGDIAYRGPAHMTEYLANPDETAALFTHDGFSVSGDLGVMTDDGYVRVTGRTKDIVIRGGMNISVREIEDNLANHPDLLASSCVGMPDERLGERVCCYVVVAAGRTQPTVEGLREFLLTRGMPIQKTPERVVAVEAMPMTATGKVLKHELRKDIERRLHEETAQATEVTGAR
jgi:cyclohexanecarboxylate-CoA ligase